MTTKQSVDGRMKTTTALAAITLALALPSGIVHAAGGGSGGGLPQQSRPQINPEQSYRDGVAALQAGDYKTAEKRFGEVLSVARKNPEANYYMGLAKVGREKHKSSVRYFERAIKERPDFVEAREQLALVFVKLEKSDKAQDQLNAIQAISDNCDADSCDRAYVERIAKAIAKVEAALGGSEEVSQAPGDELQVAGLAPRSVGVERYGDAVRLINQERFAEAIDELYDAQTVIGPHPDILNYLGYSHRKLGKFDEAKAYYADALRLDPDHLGATEYLGELYLELGDLNKARAQLARLDKLCTFGCAEHEDLARLIEVKQSVRRAGR